jgi:hypothetical protein
MNARYRFITLLAVACALAFFAGAYEAATSSHNAFGGYRDACGELPGLVGDDC